MIPDKKCDTCETIFHPSQHNQTACGPVCRRRQQYLRRRDRKENGIIPDKTAKCSVCQVEFVKRVSNQFLCPSEACKLEYYRRKSRHFSGKSDLVPQPEKRSATIKFYPDFFSVVNLNNNRKPRPCLKCGESFITTISLRICADCTTRNKSQRLVQYG